jgi:GGDEF domain-containing protein
VPESEILALSEDIARSIRDSDYFARMSTRGFWVVLHGTESECEIALARIRRIRKKGTPDYRVQIMIKLSNEGRLEWLKRIDATYFQIP